MHFKICDHSPVPVRPELSTRKKKLPSSSSSSPALIPHRIQSTVVWDRPLCFGPSAWRARWWWSGWMLVRWRNTAAVRKCFGDRAQPSSHSVTQSRWLSICWSGFPTLTVRSALPLTSHLKGEGLISRWRRCGHTERESKKQNDYLWLTPCHIYAHIDQTIDYYWWVSPHQWQPLLL